MSVEDYTRRLLTPGYLPLGEREDADQELAEAAFKLGVEARRKALDELLRSLSDGLGRKHGAGLPAHPGRATVHALRGRRRSADR